jgi:hypothetical protein
MKFKITVLVLVITTTAIVYSCDTRTYDEIGGVAVAHPTYTKDIKPIMDNYCVSCHNDSGTSPDLSTYNNVKDNADAVYSDIFSGSMPQSANKLNNNIIQTFQNWMNDGTPEN